jgi:hypothetical protein
MASFTTWPLYPVRKEPPVRIRDEVGWTPESVWTIWRAYLVSNTDPSVVQSVTSHYTD